jgi:hypothetical protein
MDRKNETIERITYELDAGEVEAAILEALTGYIGAVFNKSTQVIVQDDGSAIVSTEFAPTPPASTAKGVG